MSCIRNSQDRTPMTIVEGLLELLEDNDNSDNQVFSRSTTW